MISSPRFNSLENDIIDHSENPPKSLHERVTDNEELVQEETKNKNYNRSQTGRSQNENQAINNNIHQRSLLATADQDRIPPPITPTTRTKTTKELITKVIKAERKVSIVNTLVMG